MIKTKPIRAVYIVKPEAFDRRDEIRDYIENNSRIRIVKSVVTKLKNEDVENIYTDDLGSSLESAIKSHLVGRKVEVVLVEHATKPGIDIGVLVTELGNICGLSYDPSLCDLKTIRRRFGIIEPIYYNGTLYFLNAVHKVSLSECEKATNWCIDNIFTR